MNQKRTILVTGGLGFIGSNYLNKFVDKYHNYAFVNIDCITYAGKQSNIDEKIKKYNNYKFEKIDIRDINALEKIFCKHKPTDIIHFAAESHVDFSISNPSIFIDTNIVGTHNLLILAKKYNLDRFHHVSTDEVYGTLKPKEKAFKENSPLLPNSPYSATKTSADLLIRAYNKTFNLNTTITRCSNNYGPNQDCSKLIPKAILNILSNKKIPIYGNGLNIRDWLFVEDHVDAIDIVFHKGKSGQTYNVGGGTELTNISLIKCIIKLAKKNNNLIEFVEDRKGHDFRYAVDNSKMIKEFKWKPKHSIDKGLMMTIKFYKDNFNKFDIIKP